MFRSRQEHLLLTAPAVPLSLLLRNVRQRALGTANLERLTHGAVTVAVTVEVLYSVSVLVMYSVLYSVLYSVEYTVTVEQPHPFHSEELMSVSLLKLIQHRYDIPPPSRGATAAALTAAAKARTDKNFMLRDLFGLK